MRKYVVSVLISRKGGRIDLGQFKEICRTEIREFNCRFKWQIYFYCFLDYMGKDYTIQKITRV
jgi:hypothetical protein